EGGGNRGPHPPDPPPPNCWGRGAHSSHPAAPAHHKGCGLAGAAWSGPRLEIAPSPVIGRGGRGV
ncbi:MAG: hypothetical protein AVDCRST_MAG68-580, partial [uncultured Gemmatimonadetes bacterium]